MNLNIFRFFSYFSFLFFSLVLLILCTSKELQKRLENVYDPPFFPVLSGYAFLLFQDESSVQALIDACIEEDGKLYLCVSSPTIKDKPVSAV